MIDDSYAVDLASKGLNNYQIAARLGCDEASVRRAFKRSGYSRHLLPIDLLDSSFDIELDKPIRLSNIDVMVTADWHEPIVDVAYVNQMITSARSMDIRNLIIAGDFFNFDALSQYDPKQEDAGLVKEYQEGLRIMATLNESFDRIYYLWGNHDARMHRALGYAMKFRDAMKMVFGALGSEVLSKVEFTNLDHLWLEFDGQEFPWYICHPQSYSRIPLSTARQLAAKMNANVIAAHAHHAAMGYASDGKKVVVEAGGLFDVSKTGYLQRSTTFPTWQQGYGWFQDGFFSLTTAGWASF